jgi:predicted porin
VFVVPFSALAQGTNVTIYGTFNVDFETRPGTDLLIAWCARLQLPPHSQSSTPQPGLEQLLQYRFRSTEDLGGGLKAIFQCESATNIDNGTAAFCTHNLGIRHTF